MGKINLDSIIPTYLVGGGGNAVTAPQTNNAFTNKNIENQNFGGSNSNTNNLSSISSNQITGGATCPSICSLPGQLSNFNNNNINNNNNNTVTVWG